MRVHHWRWLSELVLVFIHRRLLHTAESTIPRRIEWHQEQIHLRLLDAVLRDRLCFMQLPITIKIQQVILR